MDDAAVSEVENFSHIKLPGAKNASLWNYFAFKSTDGKTICNEGRDKPNVYCRIAACSKPAMQYYGNTTNMVRHLQMLHPKENAKYLGRNMTTNAATPLTSFLKKDAVAD